MRRKYVKADVYSDKAAQMRQHYQDRKANAKAKKAAASNVDRVVQQVMDSDKPIETAFELLVPSSGPAETVAGELVRAMMRILYRDYNDGDLFYEGYGMETCGDAVAYLCEDGDRLLRLDFYRMFGDIAERNVTGTRYTNAIDEISDKLVDALFTAPHSELIDKKNTKDFQDYDGVEFIRQEGWEPLYDYDVMIPDNVMYHLDKDHISERDLEWEIESWDYLRDADISIERDIIYIYELPREAYDEIEGNMYKWLEQYGEELDSEYGSEDDEYDEDEEG